MVIFFVGLALAAPPGLSPPPAQATQLLEEGGGVLAEAQAFARTRSLLVCPPGSHQADVSLVEVPRPSTDWHSQIDCATDPEGCASMAGLSRPDHWPVMCGEVVVGGKRGEMCVSDGKAEGAFIIEGSSEWLFRGACRAGAPDGLWVSQYGDEVRAATRWKDGVKEGVSVEPCCGLPRASQRVRYAGGKEIERVSVSAAGMLQQYRRPDGLLWHLTQGKLQGGR